MADNTKIEWARHPVTGKGATWNPITGCELVSEGCRHCYAARMAGTRLKNTPSRQGLARRNAAGEYKFTGEVRFNPQWLTQPLQWSTPRGIFVCAHGDLFATNVPDDWIDQVFAVMALCPQHLFFVLTKRPERMRAWFLGADARWRTVWNAADTLACERNLPEQHPAASYLFAGPDGAQWPLPNVWLGTSVEDQATANTRIPDLLATPAAKRFISAEPLLGPVRLNTFCNGHYFFNPLNGHTDMNGPRLDWVIAGGESGPKARPMHPDWARGLRDQCKSTGTPFFFKQWGAWTPGEWFFDLDDVVWFVPHETTIDDIPMSEKDDPREHWFSDDKMPEGPGAYRIGKAKAGHLLDGKVHQAMPAFPGPHPEPVEGRGPQ